MCVFSNTSQTCRFSYAGIPCVDIDEHGKGFGYEPGMKITRTPSGRRGTPFSSEATGGRCSATGERGEAYTRTRVSVNYVYQETMTTLEHLI